MISSEQLNCVEIYPFPCSLEQLDFLNAWTADRDTQLFIIESYSSQIETKYSMKLFMLRRLAWSYQWVSRLKRVASTEQADLSRELNFRNIISQVQFAVIVTSGKESLI